MAILRPWRMSDIPDVARCAANPKIAANLRDCFPYPYTEADARDYVAGCIQAGESRQLCRAIEVEGRAAGSIGVFLQDDVYRKSAELKDFVERLEKLIEELSNSRDLLVLQQLNRIPYISKRHLRKDKRLMLSALEKLEARMAVLVENNQE